MRVLLVDDDVQVLRALERMFKHRVGDVRTTTSPREALDILDREPFDVVISDYRMSELDGAAFLALVAERHPRSRRILLSGSSHPPRGLDAIFITKPYTDDELLEAALSAPP